MYGASDIRVIESTADFIAYIFSPSLPWRTRVLETLKTYPEKNFILPVASGKINFSLTKTRHFTIITPKPPGIKLRDFIAQNGPQTEIFISNVLLPEFINFFRTLERFNIHHGTLNPDTVYIREGRHITIGQCFSTTPGFNQPSHYEPLERMTIHRAAKGEPDSLADYYALGMICLFVLTGADRTSGEIDPQLCIQRFNEGSYQTFTGKYNMAQRLKDLLKGLLSDRTGDRWQMTQLNEWATGKKYNVNTSPETPSASRNINFNGVYYMNYKVLAYVMAEAWDAAKTFLREDTLVKWVEKGLADSDKVSRLQYILSIARERGADSNIVEKDENLSKILLILNPESPIRLQEVSANTDGIAPLLAYAYSQGKRDFIDFIMKIINSNLWQGSTLGGGTDHRKNAIFILEICNRLLSKKGLCFGAERCLYELNPTLPCQSRIVEGGFVDSLAELLNYLNYKAEKQDIEVLDNHIAAFFGTKLKIINEIKLSSSPAFERFEKNMDLIALFLLSSAQKISEVRELKALARLMARKLKSVIDLIYSRKTKADISKRLEMLAEKGSLVEMYEVLADLNYVREDTTGFERACIRYRKLQHHIQALSQQQRIYNLGYRYGLKLSVILSYFVALLVFGILLTPHLM